MRRLEQGVPQEPGKLGDHLRDTLRSFRRQRADRIQRVEQEMRIQLISKHLEPGFVSQRFRAQDPLALRLLLATGLDAEERDHPARHHRRKEPQLIGREQRAARQADRGLIEGVDPRRDPCASSVPRDAQYRAREHEGRCGMLPVTGPRQEPAVDMREQRAEREPSRGGRNRRREKNVWEGMDGPHGQKEQSTEERPEDELKDRRGPMKPPGSRFAPRRPDGLVYRCFHWRHYAADRRATTTGYTSGRTA